MRLWILLLLGATACGGRTASDRIFVSDETGGPVVELDGSGRVIRRIAVGKRPRGLRVSPDGTTLYARHGRHRGRRPRHGCLSLQRTLGATMTWETPSLLELEMNAEIGAYQDDFGDDPPIASDDQPEPCA